MTGDATIGFVAAAEEPAAPCDPASATNHQEQEPAANDAGVARRGHIALAAQILWLSVGVVAVLYFARPVVLPLALAWVAGMALKPPVTWLREHQCPTLLAATLVLAVFLVLIGLIASRLSVPAMAWMQEAPENVSRLKERFGHVLRPARQLSKAAASVGSIGASEEPRGPAPKVEIADGRVAASVFTWTGGVLALVGEAIAILFLLLASGDSFLLNLVRALPTLHDKRRLVQISHEVQSGVSNYLFAVSLINLTLGVLVGIALSLIGMPHAAMWGAVAALLNFIPYFGPVVGLSALAMSGLLTFDGVGQGLLPFAVYLVLHLIEANAVTPLVLGRRFTLNPLIIFVSLMFFIWLWGVAGAFVAVPILVSVRVVCERVPALLPVGEFLAHRESWKPG